MKSASLLLAVAATLVACSGLPTLQAAPEKAGFSQPVENLIAGEVMALAYSGYRDGQHPSDQSPNGQPSDEQILEDLNIIASHGFTLIRMYGAGDYSQRTLELIRQHDLPIKMLLGLWLDAEFSNHEGCPWLDEPIPEAVLSVNRVTNAAEVQRGIALAKKYHDIVVAVNVGNEALVNWNDHMLPVESVIAYVREVKEHINQPVTVAENYLWWIEEGAALAAEVDFLGVHTYPAWEEKPVDEALAYTVENIEQVYAALPNRPIAILEAGWATIATEFGDRASEAAQARYYREIDAWATKVNVSVFFFEAFDEPWKGNPSDPAGAEKHWGIFNLDRSPKAVMHPQR